MQGLMPLILGIMIGLMLAQQMGGQGGQGGQCGQQGFGGGNAFAAAFAGRGGPLGF